MLRVPDWFCTDSARGEGWGSRGDECLLCPKHMFDGTESSTKDAWHEHLGEYHGSLALECAAKRHIVEAYAGVDWTTDNDYGQGIEVAVRALASVHDDHPDYDKAWAVTPEQSADSAAPTEWDVWVGGYLVTGMEGVPAPASKSNDEPILATSFNEAVRKHLTTLDSEHRAYWRYEEDIDKWFMWGCTVSPDEAIARKHFG